MNLAEINLFFLVSFAGLAFFDGIVLHLWKYKLYSHSETIYEHRLHTFRAIIFPMILIGLFLYDIRGPLFFCVLFIAILDLVIQGFDMWEEKKARTMFGGLSSIEYILHVVLTSLHTSMLLLYLIIKPKEAFNWNETQILSSSPNYYFIAINLLPGAIIVAIIHIILAHPYFRNKAR
ncbi:MAG: hypothetical protein SH817_06075 [Leptospira sp.]|nr:hypothetical protein [Leptospira sp.]